MAVASSGELYFPNETIHSVILGVYFLFYRGGSSSNGTVSFDSDEFVADVPEVFLSGRATTISHPAIVQKMQ